MGIDRRGEPVAGRIGCRPIKLGWPAGDVDGLFVGSGVNAPICAKKPLDSEVGQTVQIGRKMRVRCDRNWIVGRRAHENQNLTLCYECNGPGRPR